MGSQGDFSPPAHNKKASYAICCEDRSEISASTGKEPKNADSISNVSDRNSGVFRPGTPIIHSNVFLLGAGIAQSV
jgi:hypothetical protein